jgi:hypothetical protein
MNGVNLMNKALKSFGGDEPNPTMPTTYKLNPLFS